jgi:hypothetical protein
MDRHNVLDQSNGPGRGRRRGRERERRGDKTIIIEKET